MGLKILIHALANEIMEKAGRDVVIAAILSMMIDEFDARSRRYRSRNGRGPMDRQIYKGLPDVYGPGTVAVINYDFFEKSLKGKIQSPKMRIRESEIQISSLPDSVWSVLTQGEPDIRRLTDLAIFSDRKIEACHKSKKGQLAHFKMCKPQPVMKFTDNGFEPMSQEA